MFKAIYVSHEIIIPAATRIFVTESFPNNLEEFCKKIDQPVSLVEAHYPNIGSLLIGVILEHIKLCEMQIFSIVTRCDVTPKERLLKFYDAMLDYFSLESNALMFARIYNLDYENLGNSDISLVTRRYESGWYRAIYNLFLPMLGAQLAGDMADASRAVLLAAAEDLQERKYQQACYTINTHCTELIANWQRVGQNHNRNTKRCVAWVAVHEHQRTAKSIINQYLKKHMLNCDEFVSTQQDILYCLQHTLRSGDSLVVTSASSIGFTFAEIAACTLLAADRGIELHFAKYDRNLVGGCEQDRNTLMDVMTAILEELDAITA